MTLTFTLELQLRWSKLSGLHTNIHDPKEVFLSLLNERSSMPNFKRHFIESNFNCPLLTNRHKSPHINQKTLLHESLSKLLIKIFASQKNTITDILFILVSTLVEKGADLEAKGGHELFSPLHLGCSSQKSSSSKDSTRFRRLN